MNTLDFIRHHTRLILREESGDDPPPPPPPADYEGKYSKAVRGGRASKAAQAAEGLAKSNPKQLLSNLGMAGYKTEGSSKRDEVLNFLKKFRSATPQVSLAFDKPEMESENIEVPVRSLEKGKSAISEFQAARYVKAALTAGFLLGIIDFDPAEKKNKVQTRSVGDGDGKKYFVRVTYTP